jgi:uncharacterized protein YdhG (YjbR/CyaY superfamily)
VSRVEGQSVGVPSRKFVDYSRLIKIVFECLEWNRLVEKMYLILDQNNF